MDATEDQESQKTSTTAPLSNRRSSRSSASKQRADASVRSKARSSDKRSKEASENDSKVDTDNSRSSSSTTETHKHKSKKRKKKNKDKIDGAFATSSTTGVSAIATAAMFPEFSPGPQLTITPTPAIDADFDQPISIRAIVPQTQLDTQMRRERRMARFAYRAVVFTVIALVVVIIAILFKHKDATATAPGATASATSPLAVSTTEASADRVRTVTAASTSWTEAPAVPSVESTTEASGDRNRTVTEASTSWTEAPALPSVEVNTTSGILKGAAVDVHRVALHRWLGVPYARLGARSKRFAFAQPVKARSIPALDSKEASPPCAQVINDTLLGREDCLRVRVWAPARDSATAAKRPLLLAMTQDWFSRGTNNLLEWEMLAAKADAVVMSPNVRLGVLGYLGRTSPAESSADLAINDAVVAVRCALDNAAAFHADPSKLMLMGHGSGSYVLMAAAQALKLNCLRAVLEGPVPGSALPTNAEAVDTWNKSAAVLGCRGNSESERESCFQDAELPDLLVAAANVTFRFVPRWKPSEWPTNPAASQVQEVIAGVDVDEVRVLFEERVKPWAITKKCAATVTRLYGCTLEYLFTNRTAAYENLLWVFRPNNEPDIVHFLAMLMSGCDTHRIAKGASKAGYHYITEGPGRTLFEPVLDVDVLTAFLKTGTVPELKSNVVWHPMTSSDQASRVVLANGTDVMDNRTISEACHITFTGPAKRKK